MTTGTGPDPRPDVPAPDTGVAESALFEPGDYEPGAHGRVGSPETPGAAYAEDEPPHPINWNLLTAEEAESEWLDLNAWVHWLRATYGLPPTVVPPFWGSSD